MTKAEHLLLSRLLDGEKGTIRDLDQLRKLQHRGLVSYVYLHSAVQTHIIDPMKAHQACADYTAKIQRQKWARELKNPSVFTRHQRYIDEAIF